MGAQRADARAVPGDADCGPPNRGSGCRAERFRRGRTPRCRRPCGFGLGRGAPFAHRRQRAQRIDVARGVVVHRHAVTDEAHRDRREHRIDDAEAAAQEIAAVAVRLAQPRPQLLHARDVGFGRGVPAVGVGLAVAVHRQLPAQRREPRMHFRRRRAGLGARRQGGRPAAAVEPALVGVLADRQRIPDHQPFIVQRRDAPGRRPAPDLVMERGRVEREQVLLEADAEMPQQQPRPQRPRGVVLVADDEQGHGGLRGQPDGRRPCSRPPDPPARRGPVRVQGQRQPGGWRPTVKPVAATAPVVLVLRADRRHRDRQRLDQRPRLGPRAVGHADRDHAEQRQLAHPAEQGLAAQEHRDPVSSSACRTRCASIRLAAS